MIPHCLTADNIQGLSDYEFPKFLVRFLSMLYIILILISLVLSISIKVLEKIAELVLK